MLPAPEGTLYISCTSVSEAERDGCIHYIGNRFVECVSERGGRGRVFGIRQEFRTFLTSHRRECAQTANTLTTKTQIHIYTICIYK